MFIDLYMVIRAPFNSQKSRLNFLINASFLAALLFAMANYAILKSQSTVSERFNVIFFFAICASNLITSMVCVVWIVVRFRKETTNKEFKTAISRRYIEFFLTFCIFELPFIIITRPFYGWKESANGATNDRSDNQFFSGT
jgi:heme/copper-type cytochrome/quinol oxidase subunit 2